MIENTELEMNSPDAEKALIGSLRLHADAMSRVLADLEGDDFFKPARGVVWDAARKLAAAGDPVTPISLGKKLSEDGNWNGGTEQVVRHEMLYGGCNPVLHAGYAAEVAEMARRRELIQLSGHIRQVVTDYGGTASEILARVRGIIQEVKDGAEEIEGPSNWDELVAEFESEQATGGGQSIPSPWWQLDELTGGFYPGRVYVFGGRPGEGKSTAAANIALHAAVDSRKEVLIISKEMPKVDVMGRLLASGAEVPLSEINARLLAPQNFDKLRAYVKKVNRPRITVDDRPRALSGIVNLARAHKHRHGLDILVVDYLQLIRTDGKSRTRENEVAEVSMTMKALSMELKCSVILPAQLNRGNVNRADSKPQMSDLRDSGQIEQDADAIVLLDRFEQGEDVKVPKVSFILAKNRHGPTGDMTFDFRGRYGVIE